MTYHDNVSMYFNFQHPKDLSSASQRSKRHEISYIITGEIMWLNIPLSVMFLLENGKATGSPLVFGVCFLISSNKMPLIRDSKPIN